MKVDEGFSGVSLKPKSHSHRACQLGSHPYYVKPHSCSASFHSPSIPKHHPNPKPHGSCARRRRYNLLSPPPPPSTKFCLPPPSKHDPPYLEVPHDGELAAQPADGGVAEVNHAAGGTAVAAAQAVHVTQHTRRISIPVRHTAAAAHSSRSNYMRAYACHTSLANTTAVG